MDSVKKAFSSFSVKDIEAAKKFYKETLGFSVNHDKEMDVLMIELPGTTIMVYPKSNHEPATFTVFHLMVEDLEKEVNALTEKGISFIQYDEPMKTNEKGIYKGEYGEQLAWFADPSENIIGLMQKK